jgi:hypothetical protein
MKPVRSFGKGNRELAFWQRVPHWDMLVGAPKLVKSPVSVSCCVGWTKTLVANLDLGDEMH